MIKEKNRKWASKHNCKEQEYHLQEDDDVIKKGIKMFCDTTQFPSLEFCGTHAKPHGVQGLRKHYNMRLNPKLGHGTCEIC